MEEAVASAEITAATKRPKFKIASDMEQDDLECCLDSKDENAEFMADLWWTLPEPVLVKILWLLPIRDMLNVGATCRRWYDIANDNHLWRRRFQHHFKTDPSIQLKPGECDQEEVNTMHLIYLRDW